jgi:hypothetical protein
MNKDEALKMAIEALEHAELVFYITKDDGSKVSIYAETINACKEALATNEESSVVQPAQEPVAWIKDWADGSKELVPNKYDGSYPVYTHPAQPLDIEILNSLYDMAEERDGDAFDFDHIKFARAIEKAHGIAVNDG